MSDEGKGEGTDSDSESSRVLLTSNHNNNSNSASTTKRSSQAGSNLCINLQTAVSQESKRRELGELGEELLVQEKEVLCVFQLSDGSCVEREFKLGHTIEFLKAFIESETGISMDKQVFKSILLMNFISLCIL